MSRYVTDLGIGSYKIYQGTEAYAFSQDSVFLANMAKLGTRDSVLDLGCGSGILAILALIKKHVKKAVGIEIQTELCEMAKSSAQLNGLDLEIINCDVKNISDHIAPESFDKILCNPPYFPAQSPKAAGGAGLCRSESTATLDDFVKAAGYSLKFGGDLWIVIKVSRLAELCASLQLHGLAAKNMIFIYPKLSKGIDTVVVGARKGAKDGVVARTFIAQNEDGEFTEQYKELYR